MSHSSSGLRGVTLNDLFVVTAKRATDMRSLGEAVHGTPPGEKPKSAAFYALNWLLDAATYSTLAISAFTLSDAMMRYSPDSVRFLDPVARLSGPEPVKLIVAAMISVLMFGLFSLLFRDRLQSALQLKSASAGKATDGYVAWARLPRGGLTFGPLKVTYSITPDALVIRSLKDHAVSVISMEMICNVFLGNAEQLFSPSVNEPGNESLMADRRDLHALGIDAKTLRSWYGPKNTYPVVVSLRSGETCIPLIIHGLYFDGQASKHGSNADFVSEFRKALANLHGDHEPANGNAGDHGHHDHGGGHH